MTNIFSERVVFTYKGVTNSQETAVFGVYAFSLTTRPVIRGIKSCSTTTTVLHNNYLHKRPYRM